MNEQQIKTLAILGATDTVALTLVDWFELDTQRHDNNTCIFI